MKKYFFNISLSFACATLFSNTFAMCLAIVSNTIAYPDEECVNENALTLGVNVKSRGAC